MFRHLKSQLKELHVILACDEDPKKVFPEVPIIGFRNNKNLKSHLVRATQPDIDEVGRCEPSGGKNILVNYAVTGKIKVLLKVNIQTKFIK